MKRNFSKTSTREKVDKIEKKATSPLGSRKEMNAKKRLSIYDDFDDDEMDDYDLKPLKNVKFKK